MNQIARGGDDPTPPEGGTTRVPQIYKMIIHIHTYHLHLILGGGCHARRLMPRGAQNLLKYVPAFKLFFLVVALTTTRLPSLTLINNRYRGGLLYHCCEVAARDSQTFGGGAGAWAPSMWGRVNGRRARGDTAAGGRRQRARELPRLSRWCARLRADRMGT
jgi:hypothetical protein